MALCNFENFSLVSKISQILSELEPHNLINKLVVMRTKLEGPIASGQSMVLCKFGQFSLVSKISKKLFELEPHNLINRLVVMRKWPDFNF